MKPSLERESQVYVHNETLRKEILRQSGMRKHSRFFLFIKSICFCRRCHRCQSSPHFSRGKLWCSSGKLKFFFISRVGIFRPPFSHISSDKYFALHCHPPRTSDKTIKHIKIPPFKIQKANISMRQYSLI